VQVGGSIGIALYPDHGLDMQTLLRRADVAMYVAKRSGDVYAVYSEEQDRYTPERLALIADLRQAIADGALVLHYQPTIDLATGRANAAEALVRWEHPERGLLGPGQFIPLAEETGLIGPLTHWVIETALGQCGRWRQAGIDVSVAVNLSMATLHDPQLPELITYLLQTHELPPSRLRMEVTESILMDDLRQTQDVLCRLAALGVRISVDDYGTGYSSLAYLKRLPVDELKIDMSFVRHLREDKTDAAIVASTIDLGHHLGLRVVAEGVEDQQTRERLTAMGCDAAQGYFWSRPLPAEQALQRMRELAAAPA
jgi:EAL domain-containing protein (putative c-di-GMP-specific phosphodiesterase class I)